MSSSTPMTGEASGWSEPLGQRTVTHSAITRFGELTGDYAQMHFDRDFGPAQGMGGTIAHGLLSASWSLGALALHAPERLALGDPDATLTGYRVRFSKMIFVGDLFSLRWRAGDQPAVDGLAPAERTDTEFEILNQAGQIVTSGSVSVSRAASAAGSIFPEAGPPLDLARGAPEASPPVVHAEDMLEHGPRGQGFGRTVSEADLVGWSNFTGALDPATLDGCFAERSRFGARVCPPLWVFCRAFGDFLRDLLRVAMPSSGFAGHLGDAFRVLAPVYPGDTLTTRHRPVSFTPSRSRPGMGIVGFALEVVNQHGRIVQEGRVHMMMATRQNASRS